MKLIYWGGVFTLLNLCLASCQQFNSYQDVLNNRHVLSKEHAGDDFKCVLTFQPLWLKHWLQNGQLPESGSRAQLHQDFGNYLNFILEIESDSEKNAESIDFVVIQEHLIAQYGDMSLTPALVQEENTGWPSKKRFIISFRNPEEDETLHQDFQLILSSPNSDRELEFTYERKQFNNINLI